MNEPAGRVAQVAITHAVNAIVRAWDDPNIDPRRVADEVLEVCRYSYFPYIQRRA